MCVIDIENFKSVIKISNQWFLQLSTTTLKMKNELSYLPIAQLIAALDISDGQLIFFNGFWNNHQGIDTNKRFCSLATQNVFTEQNMALTLFSTADGYSSEKRNHQRSKTDYITNIKIKWQHYSTTKTIRSLFQQFSRILR